MIFAGKSDFCVEIFQSYREIPEIFKKHRKKISDSLTLLDSKVEGHPKFQMANILHNRYISIFSISYRLLTLLLLSITMDKYRYF